MLKLRWWYQGEVPRNGRVSDIAADPDGTVPGTAVLGALEQGGVDVTRFIARCFDEVADGWMSVRPEHRLSPRTDRATLDIRLEDASSGSQLYQSASGQAATSNGYFGIGICGGKTAANQGTLWRSAYQMGAQYTFMIGARFDASKVKHTGMTALPQRCCRLHHSVCATDPLTP